MKWVCLIFTSVVGFVYGQDNGFSYEMPVPEQLEENYHSSLIAEAFVPIDAPFVNAEIPTFAVTEDSSIALLEEASVPEWLNFSIDFRDVFSGAPWIYSIMLVLSFASCFIWLYNILSMKKSFSSADSIIKSLRHHLHSNRYEEATLLCSEHHLLVCNMVKAAIKARKLGGWMMLETMRAEGKRYTLPFWQRLGLLNDIAIIAPMLGLLGTVLGMFYAFYDMDRSMTSLSHLFDGLGVSVGTTLAGLCVAIVSLALHAIGKYRLVSALSRAEAQAEGLTQYLADVHV